MGSTEWEGIEGARGEEGAAAFPWRVGVNTMTMHAHALPCTFDPPRAGFQAGAAHLVSHEAAASQPHEYVWAPGSEPSQLATPAARTATGTTPALPTAAAEAAAAAAAATAPEAASTEAATAEPVTGTTAVGGCTNEREAAVPNQHPQACL